MAKLTNTSNITKSHSLTSTSAIWLCDMFNWRNSPNANSSAGKSTNLLWLTLSRTSFCRAPISLGNAVNALSCSFRSEFVVQGILCNYISSHTFSTVRSCRFPISGLTVVNTFELRSKLVRHSWVHHSASFWVFPLAGASYATSGSPSIAFKFHTFAGTVLGKEAEKTLLIFIPNQSINRLGFRKIGRETARRGGTFLTIGI